MLPPTGTYFMYLRKSREDMEAERHGQGETLARHEAQLRETADRLNITITSTYREIVSGETIAARPEMIRMLNDIETYKPDGVLVTEIPRLARGDTRDQGLVMETFKYAGTHIITPNKVYNPNDEFDEEYAEFGLFMSRREYAGIKRRLQNGKVASVKEGKFAGTRVPYGYERYKLAGEKGFSLRIIPAQAQVVRLIYELYISGTPESRCKPVGPSAIARILNDMYIPTQTGKSWLPGVIRTILTNSVYIGMVHWGKRKTVRVIKDGVPQKSHPVQPEYITAPGRHEAIIDHHTWDEAQKLFSRRTRRPPFLDSGLRNSLAGILRCSKCQRTMVRRPAGNRDHTDWIICNTCGCPAVGSDFHLVERCIVEVLTEWLKDYQIDPVKLPSPAAAGMEVLITSLENNAAALATLNKQLEKAYTLLETDIYTPEIFRERSMALNEQITETKQVITETEQKINTYNQQSEHKSSIIISKCENLLTHYWEMTPDTRNCLLKELVFKIEYDKTSRGTKRTYSDFYLKIYPLL